MKTPEEIKKGLELHRGNLLCDSVCPYDGWNTETGSCVQRLMKDTVEYIQWLESRVAQAEKERNAAIADLNYLGRTADDTTCHLCNLANCSDCRPGNDGFEWRGIRPGSSKDGADA